MTTHAGRQSLRRSSAAGTNRRWLSTIAAATSATLRPLCCEWSRSMPNALSASMECRAIRIPFACSITARRPNAPCRLWYSENRWSVMSIALCSSSGVVSTMYAKTPRLAASSDVGGVFGGQHRDHRAGRFVDDLPDQLEGMVGREAEPDQCHVGLLPCGHRADFVDVDLPGDHLVPETGRRRARATRVGRAARWRSGLAGADSCRRPPSCTRATGCRSSHDGLDSSGVLVERRRAAATLRLQAASQQIGVAWKSAACEDRGRGVLPQQRGPGTGDRTNGGRRDGIAPRRIDRSMVAHEPDRHLARCGSSFR